MKGLALSAGGAVVASLAITAANVYPAEPGRFALTSVLILLGPGAGWILAWLQGALPGALELLLPVTVGCGLAMAAYIRWRSAVLLALATLLWIMAGYLFTIAIWI